jgi:hypothetical protein
MLVGFLLKIISACYYALIIRFYYSVKPYILKTVLFVNRNVPYLLQTFHLEICNLTIFIHF